MALNPLQRSSTLGLLLLVACSVGGPPVDDDDATGDPPEAEHLFDFVVIADPHIAGPVDHEIRLAAAVSWVNDHREEYGIELVVVLGDIGWSGGLDPARDHLDGLDVPYVPIIGDNEVQTGEEQLFDEAFAAQYETLSSSLVDWAKAPLPVWHDLADEETWLQNTRFEHGGVLFVSQDWNARGVTGVLGEFGELNDVSGGSWEWLEAALSDAPERPDESIVLLSHVPMAPGFFDVAERARFSDLVTPIGDKVFANFAGHLHDDYEEEFPESGYTTVITDATWDDEITVRRVSVSGDGASMSYAQELVVIEQ